jgi:hypothetical protein
MNEDIGETEHTVTLEQALEPILLTDLQEIDPNGHDRLRRFQELGAPPLAAEALRRHQRDVGAGRSTAPPRVGGSLPRSGGTDILLAAKPPQKPRPAPRRKEDRPSRPASKRPDETHDASAGGDGREQRKDGEGHPLRLAATFSARVACRSVHPILEGSAHASPRGTVPARRGTLRFLVFHGKPGKLAHTRQEEPRWFRVSPAAVRARDELEQGLRISLS